mgnify:CR=1 FL=1
MSPIALACPSAGASGSSKITKLSPVRRRFSIWSFAESVSAPAFALTNLHPSPITAETDLVIQTQAGWSGLYCFGTYTVTSRVVPGKTLDEANSNLTRSPTGTPGCTWESGCTG